MKKLLVLLAAGMIPAMTFAVSFSLQPRSGWKKTAENGASIDYKGNKIWPNLDLKLGGELKPNTLYRLTFEAQSTGSPEPIQFLYQPVLKGKLQNARPSFKPTKEFKKYTIYFTSGETGKLKITRFLFNPTTPFVLELKDIKLDEMTDAMLYGKNLLSFGDFEEDNTFRPYNPAMAPNVKIVDSPDFFSGEKSLLLICPKGTRTEITSCPVPAIPGREIEVKFFAKSADAAKICVIIDFGGGFGGKHYYRSYNFRVEKEWKEFSLKCKVSEDAKTYPVIVWNLTAFRIGGQSFAKGADARIYLDGISYTLKKQEK